MKVVTLVDGSFAWRPVPLNIARTASSSGPGNLRMRYLQSGIQREVLVTEQTKPRLDLCPFPQSASDKIKRTLSNEKYSSKNGRRCRRLGWSVFPYSVGGRGAGFSPNSTPIDHAHAKHNHQVDARIACRFLNSYIDCHRPAVCALPTSSASDGEYERGHDYGRPLLRGVGARRLAYAAAIVGDHN